MDDLRDGELSRCRPSALANWPRALLPHGVAAGDVLIGGRALLASEGGTRLGDHLSRRLRRPCPIPAHESSPIRKPSRMGRVADGPVVGANRPRRTSVGSWNPKTAVASGFPDRPVAVRVRGAQAQASSL